MRDIDNKMHLAEGNDLFLSRGRHYQISGHERQLNYSIKQLELCQPAGLLCDKPRPATLSGEAGEEQITITGSLYESLQRYCKIHQVESSTVLLAAFGAVHYRLTGVDDATIGLLTSNRVEIESEDYNTSSADLKCIRITLQDESFGELISQVKSSESTASENHDGHFETIAKELKSRGRDMSKNPLIRMVIAVQPRPKDNQTTFEAVKTEKATSTTGIAGLDLKLQFLERDSDFAGSVRFAMELFDRRTIRAMISIFYEILRQGLDQPFTPIVSLPLSDSSSSLSKMNFLQAARTVYPRESSVIDVFRDQVTTWSDKVAVKDASSQLTYAELDRQSDELSNWLSKRHITPETLVGVLAPRSCETVVAFLGILKANLAYLPLDIRAPAGRIDAILKSVSGHKLVLLGKDVTLSTVQPEDVEFKRIAEVLQEEALTVYTADEQQRKGTILSTPLATSLAYVIFTSGSTGRPKGVMIEHRGIVRFVKQTNITLGLDITQPMAHMSTLAFDASTWEIYTALLNGGTLICIDTMTVLDATALCRIFTEESIRFATTSPALLKQWLQERPDLISDLDALLIAGDRFDPQDAMKARDIIRGKVVNAYGPTENTGLSTIHVLAQGEHYVNGVPIGHTVSNSGAYVMDTRQRLVPVGVRGELVVTGDGLARGYMDPRQDQDRFIEVEINGQFVKAYRTGDYVRHRPIDGLLEYFGRIDHQVKIRGHRVELGEVEHALLNSSLVTDAVALFQSQDGQDPRLVCFVTPQRGLEGNNIHDTALYEPKVGPSEQDLRKWLLTRLPSYMVPASIKIIEKMPLNESGKVDRHMLAQQIQVAAAEPDTTRVPPRNDLERSLCIEFGRVLGSEVGITDGFFDLGGHSLMATRVVSRINKNLEAGITVRDIFDCPTIVALADRIKPLLRSARYKSIPKSQEAKPAEQSFAQGRLWFLDQLYPNSTRYLLNIAFRLRGPLQLSALCAALQALEHRHETLRTTFEQRDGVDVQIIRPYNPRELKVINAPIEESGNLQLTLRQEQTRPFNLTTESAWRVSVFRFGGEEHVLSIVMHHIISDGWSLDILYRELKMFYFASLKGQDCLSQVIPLPIQYQDFSMWQKQPDQLLEQERQLQYWIKQLEGSHPAELPCDKPRPAVPSGEAGEEQMVIEGALHDSLRQFCKVHQVTPFIVLLAAFRATHYRLTGKEDATIGSLIANRNRQELEELIGFFVNLQCMRIRVHDESFEGLVRKVESTATAAFANQDVPFDKIVTMLQPGARDASRNPLVQVTLAVHSLHEQRKLSLEGLNVEPINPPSSIRFDLQLEFFEGVKDFRGRVLFATELFDRRTINNMIYIFYEVLRQGLEQPDTPIISLPLSGGSTELRTMGLMHIKQSDYPRQSSVVDVFREQVAAWPDNVAVKDASTQLTYAELDHKSDELSYWLSRKSLAPETLVGVLAPRSCETVVAFLGILKAALAYLPLDVGAPASRIETILASIKCHKLVLLGKDVSAQVIGGRDVEAVRIAESLSERTKTVQERRAANAANRTPSATSLAYVMFTSGSTGQPKGVMTEHRAIMRLVKQKSVTSRLQVGSRVAHMANIAFDVSTWEIYTALLNGATLVCIDAMVVLDVANLSQTFARESIYTAKFTPALLNQCLIESPDMIRRLGLLLSTGDRLHPQDAMKARSLLNKGELFNCYGPTENTGHSTMYRVPLRDEFPHGVPIGRAISNSGAYIMDVQQRLVPIGIVGELVLTGDGLARGYINPMQNSDRFIKVQVDGQTVQAYRTGDFARYRPKDGQLEFLGRLDHQIKIRGNRVELQEIEHSLVSHDLVSNAAVLVRARGEQDLDLVGFVTLRRERGVETLLAPSNIVSDQDAEEQLRKWLQTKLPSYMVPTVIKVLGNMPFNENGKVNRRALKERAQTATASKVSSVHVLPRDDIERALCKEFADVLGLDVGITDSFFDLGGHSLLATRVVSRINRTLEAGVTVRHIFSDPTVIALAEKIRPLLGSAPYRTIPRNKESGPVEQSFAQGRLWFLDQLYPNSTRYLINIAFRLHGPLCYSALSKALLALEQRHETLRTTFEQRDGVDIQVVQPLQPKELRIVDIADDGQSLTHALLKEQTNPFNLTADPAWRVSVFRIRENQHALSIVLHHIISDGWSRDVIYRELALFYSASLRGQDLLSKITPLPIQYRDFAVWQRQQDQVREHDRQLGYWAQQLEGSKPAELLCDRVRPSVLSGEAGEEEVIISGPLYERLQHFYKSRQVTPFITLLAVFGATHYRLTGIEDATIGTPIANRNRQELEGLIGFFVNLQCIRITVQDESFEELVQQVQSTSTTAFANQDVPFESIVAELQPGARDASRNPIAQMTFAVHSQQEIGGLKLDGLEVEPETQLKTTRFDLEFHLLHGETDIRGSVLFATELFDRRTIRAMISIFYEVLNQGLDQPNTPIVSLPLSKDLSPLREISQVKQTNYPREASVVDVFRQQVALSPNTLAVKDASTQLTYAQLDQRSDELACWLINRCFPAETLIGVYAPRSWETIVAFFGILKANLAYLPLDVRAPAGRIETILRSVPGHKLVLLGKDVSLAAIHLEDVDFKQIATVLEETVSAIDRQTGALAISPLATSLAYVMFTSGSTGRPKGVMIEHRGIVRLVKQTNINLGVNTTRHMAHIANIAFDASTWEIYTPLLNGGTLVCIDTMTVLDPAALRQVFSKESIRLAMISPALLKQCLQDYPDIIADLDQLLIAGDRFDPQDALRARSITRGNILNGYGPTENTVLSTVHFLKRDEDYANGVPIGRAISNSGAYVMDKRQRLVPIGVRGELVVTGDGLARGYIDSRQNQNRFIKIEVDGKLVRAYRTGDYVRRRPTDGQLEFFGRVDNQIKIRGHRIELGEVEYALLGHGSLKDVAVVARKQDEQTTELVGFVVLQEDLELDDLYTEPGDLDEKGDVEGWKELYDNVTYAAIDSINHELLGKDFMGWTSMYDGSQIKEEEMTEWLNDTIGTIRNGCSPYHILEVGTGTGMILFNLAGSLESYVGLEPAETAVAFVTKMVKTIPRLTDKVEVQVGTAADISTLPRLKFPTTVVVNSVLQYFPSPEYFTMAVEDLLRLQGVRQLFFGDVRSFALYRQFQTTMALHRVGDVFGRDQVRQQMEQVELGEKELLIDPAFFTSLQTRFPDLIEHVEILPKRMKATNELSCYRYAAVVHVKSKEASPLHVINVNDDRWLNFVERELDRPALLRLLQKCSASSHVAVSNIPHSKTMLERCVLESLEQTDEDATDSDWLFSLRQMATSRPSLSAVELEEVAKESGFRVEISWARQFSQRGGLDAVFHRFETDGNGERVLFHFPTDHRGRPTRSFTNRPLHQRLKQRMEEQLLTQLRTMLPSYMVPTTIKVLEEMPVNTNGKVDRQALTNSAQISVMTRTPTVRVPPRNPLERILCEEFAHVLGCNVGITNSFFDLGGHSLMATRVVSRINKNLETGITVRDVFDCPVVETLAARIRPLLKTAIYAPILKTQEIEPVEQSFAQRRLWFLEQLYPNSPRYLMNIAFRIQGRLHLRALHAALLALENRHETLRTTFEQRDGVSVQVVQPFKHRELRVLDISSGKSNRLQDALRQEQKTPFDLTTEPGWRVSVIRLNEEDHVLSIVMHHIVSDGWSIDVLLRELREFYSMSIRSQDPLQQVAPLSIQYKDFAAWQRQQDQVLEHEQQLAYWTKQLEGSQPLELLYDRPRPTVLSGAAGDENVVIEGSLYEALQSFCKACQVTPFITLLAAFRATHYRLTGSEDATVGSLIANRNRQELEDMIGFFVNLQCIRITVHNETFKELVQQVQSTATTAFAHQDVPFERIVAELQPSARDASRNPLVQTTFAVHSQEERGQLVLEGVRTEPMIRPKATRFDLEFHLFQGIKEFRGAVLFATELFDRRTIRAMITVFYEVLKQGLNQPNTPVNSLPLLNDCSSLDTIGLSKVEQTDYPREASVVDVFRQQVALSPNTLAVKDASIQLTYTQLDQKSDELSIWLLKRGYPAETLIGVLGTRSCEIIVAFLGILKANLAYLPLDINAPRSRTEAILESIDSHKLILIGSGVASSAVQLDNLEVISIAEALRQQGLTGKASSQQAGTIATAPSATSLAYVMFTSGSTGRPKGVMIEHRGIVRLVKQTNVTSQLNAAWSIAHMADITFDVSTEEIYMALLNGATLVCIDRMTILDLGNLHRVFIQNDVRVALITPALLKQCLQEVPAVVADLEALFVTGDRFDARDASRANSVVRGQVINAYGPTENTGLSTIYFATRGEDYVNGVPIGRAISNSGAYVMDSNLRLVPVGVRGELVVTGEGLARGYTDPEQNKGRFVDVEVNGQLLKAYRTGDYVRQRPTDGQLEFFGRIDRQVKIRGHRVELQEIETALLNCSIVTDAVVLVRDQDAREPELASFVTVGAADGPFKTYTLSNSDEQKRVQEWTELYNAQTYADVDQIAPKSLGRDFVGWTSRYDNQQIAQDEMEEWLDDTIHTILNGGLPGSVLEVGTGTGMILFNIIDGLQSYVGLDLAETAVRFVNETARSMPTLADKVSVHVGTAADLKQLDVPGPTDTVVINSVAQYFPSAEYLFGLVEELLRLPKVGRLFFGDIRSLALYKEFQVTTAIRLSGGIASKGRIQQTMADIEREEEELLVDPAFFTVLADRFPHLIRHVEILPKRMSATNELSSYRYAAVIHLSGGVSEAQQIHQVDEDTWIDFVAESLDRETLSRLLQTAGTSLVAVNNIPYSKIHLERQIVDALESQVLEDGDFLSALHEQATRRPSLSAVDLADLAETAGYRVEISWARQSSQHGGLDAIFHRIQPKCAGERTLFKFRTDHQDRSLDALTNRPMQRRLVEAIEKELFEELKAQLPSYMVPTELRVLNKLPVNKNGKVDRQALLSTTQAPIRRATQVPPRNDIERAICEEFERVLGSKVGVTDNFFDVGGHSLMAIRVMSWISKRLYARVTVRDIVDYPTAEGLARRVVPFNETDTHLLDSLTTSGVQGLGMANGMSRTATHSQSGPTDPVPLVEELMKDIEGLVQNVSMPDVEWSVNEVGCPREVFLTGATGYFGSALMHQLLLRKQVRCVHVLVRARSVQQAEERIVKSASIAGWWDASFAPRISYWLGDLCRPRLGLSDSQWNKLSGAGEPHECIDGIVHSGARVNWYSRYESLRAANVVSTYQLLQIASKSPYLRRFIYVSTAPSMNFDSSIGGDEALRHALGSLNGYVCSKLISEQLLLRTTALAQFPSHRIVILKPGFIIGNAESGVANVDDFVWRVVAGCVSIGCYPEASDHSIVYISSHDSLASTAIDTLYNRDINHTMKIGASGMLTRKFWKAVNAALPHQLKAKPVNEWRNEIAARSEELGPNHPIISVLHVIMDGDEVMGEETAHHEYRSFSEQAELQNELQATVSRNVRYLFDIEYFSTSWAAKPKGLFFGRGSVHADN